MDFCGYGPDGIVRPGTVNFYDNGKVIRSKAIKLLQSEKWEKFEGKNKMTRPQLGCNLYAADREKPQVPWKPNT